jgi:hypothetical protein
MITVCFTTYSNYRITLRKYNKKDTLPEFFIIKNKIQLAKVLFRIIRKKSVTYVILPNNLAANFIFDSDFF